MKVESVMAEREALKAKAAAMGANGLLLFGSAIQSPAPPGNALTS